MWSCIGGGVVLLGIIAAIVIPIILRVDYSTAYNAAQDLKPKILDISQNSDCQYVVKDLNSVYTSTTTYNGYVEGCRETFNQSVETLIEELGGTDGIIRNTDIKNQFDAFKAAYDATVPKTEDLDNKLDIYTAFHSFIVTVDDFYSSDVTDAEIAAAAKYLTESGNNTLKEYGEGWLEKYSAYIQAYRDWDNFDWGANNYSTSAYYEKSNLSSAAKTEYSNWVTANKPDIKSMYQLNFDNIPKIKTEFNKLYELIRTTYEENYNYDSGDCTELLYEVICD